MAALMESGSIPTFYACPACGDIVHQVLLPVGQWRHGRAGNERLVWCERELHGAHGPHICRVAFAEGRL